MERIDMQVFWGCCAALALLTPASGIAGEKSSSWELMGVRIGMSEEAARAQLPNAKCSVFADGTTSLCRDGDRKLAGERAGLTVKFLDGQVVAVIVEGISMSQVMAGAEALSVKFGAADKQYKVRADLHKADNNCGSCLYPAWSWADGNVRLFTVASDFYSKRNDHTYSAIILQDEAVHNGLWVPKYNGKAPASEI